MCSAFLVNMTNAEGTSVIQGGIKDGEYGDGSE